MRDYFFRSNTFMQRLWPDYHWTTPDKGIIYLTFDDGPHPTITPFVLELLQRYNATATFFCIGNNVHRYPTIYNTILAAGHTIGNHTYDHLNGWQTPNSLYVKNVLKARQAIASNLFRPPYGRIKGKQARLLMQRGYKIVMWSLLTGDFDLNLSPEACLKSTIKKLQEGDIVVFHDSEKAWDRLSYVLPRLLAYCKDKNWEVKGLDAF